MRNSPPADETPDDERPPSKSQVKREMHALRDLGAALIELNPARLAEIDMPDTLRNAVLEAQRITAHGGKKRQMQYIGKLMRDVDPAPIQAKLDVWSGQSRLATAQMHLVERWRDRLLADDAALTELLAAHPQADSQQLRNLIRNTKREREANKPPRAYRELFAALKIVLGID
jgi:ribosome-associated protein